MHELSLAQNIIEIVQDTLKDQNGGAVTEVGVDIGELVAVIPDSLEFCYNALVEDTSLKGSRLKINLIPLKGICQSCKNEFQIKHMAAPFTDFWRTLAAHALISSRSAAGWAT